MRYKITVEYDGTDLLGWQKQLDGPSAQEYLEKSVYAFCQENVEVAGAGRTDAGVHALNAVAHFDIGRDVEVFRLREALNFHLREMNAPVAVLLVQKTNEDFHARFSAKKRTYIYKITNRRAPLALDKNRSWQVPLPLDVKKMQEASQHLIGTHDFSSFRAAACQAASPIKTLDKIEISQIGENIRFYFEAKSFLHHQVRNIVGTLKSVGDGHLNPSDVKTILEQKDRTQASATAPACGLYLNSVEY